MKRIIYIVLIISFFVLSISILIKPAIIFLVKSQLKKAFPESTVSIGSCSLKPTRLLILSDIEIERKPIYDFKIKEARIRYELFSIFKMVVAEFYIRDASLESKGFQVKDASLKFIRQLLRGEFSIAQIKYDKAKIDEINGNLRMENRNLFLDSLSAKTLDGKLEGDISLQTDKNGEYSANLIITDLDFSTLVRDFNLGEKFQMTGKLDGKAALKGRGINLSILSGDFSTAEPGGTLVIRDNKFLENLARNSGQSLDILVESFKDYQYNTGMLKLFLDKGNLILDLALDGEAGKRNLNITVHDFKLKKEE